MLEKRRPGDHLPDELRREDDPTGTAPAASPPAPMDPEEPQRRREVVERLFLRDEETS